MNKIINLLLTVSCLVGVLQLAVAQDTANPTDQNTWQVTPSDYPNSMIITAVIDIEGEESTDPNDRVAVFIEGTNNIRGVASPSYIPALDRYMLSLFVYSTNGISDNLAFQVYDASNDLVLPSTNSEIFGTDKLVGSFAEPDTISTVRIQANFSKDDVLCAADNFGFAKANVTGGSTPYSYLWSTGATTDSIGGLSAGQYFLTITDNNNFSKVDSVEILNLNRPIEPPILAAAPDELVCEGQDVYLFAFSTETEGPAYEWYDNFGNFIQSDNTLFIPDMDVSRQYDVQTNVRNCLSAQSTIDINVQGVPDPGFAISNFEPTPQEAIVFTPASANEPVSFEWDFGDGNTSTETTPTHAYAAAGNYLISLTITTLEGCSQTITEFISVDERQVDVLVDIESPNCAFDPSGSISVQAINGIPPYTFGWDTGDNTAQIDGLIAGVYGLTVTDALGNTAERVIELTATDNLAAAEVAINGGSVICPGDDVLLAAFSTDEGVSFRWYNDALGTQLLSVSKEITLFGLSTNRTIWVETRRGNCTSAALTQVDLIVEDVEADFVVNAPAVPTNTSISFAASNNTAGNTYNWIFGDGSTASGPGPVNYAYTIAGTYEVALEVTSPNGCVNTSQQFVNIWGGALELLPVVQNADCAGNASGSISLQILNGQAPFSYQWSTGSIQPALDQLLPGVYGVTVSDAGGLSTSAQITLGEEGLAPDAPTLIVNGGNTVCAGDDTWINAYSDRPGAQFFWYAGALDNNPIHVGSTLFLFGIENSENYFVETRVGSCISPRSQVNVQVSNPDASFSTNMEVTFVSQAIQFSVDNPTFGLAYDWDWGDNTPNSALTSVLHTFDIAGIYEVQLTARSLITGCEDTEIIRIQIVDLSGTGNPDDDEPLSALPLAEPAKCPDSPTGQLSAFAIGGNPPYTYQWSNGSSAAFQTGVVPGTYFVTVTDSDGTEAVGSAMVGTEGDIGNPLAIVNGGQDVCIGEPIWLGAISGDPDATYQWFLEVSDPLPTYVGSSVQVNGLEAQDTIYLLASSEGCFSEIVPVSIEFAVANANFSVDIPTAEVGQSISFAADSLSVAYEYTWDFGDGNTSTNPLATHDYGQPGLYEVYLTVETTSGCMASQRRFITVYEPDQSLYLTFSMLHPHCPEDETGSITALAFGGQPPYSYAWSDGTTTETLIGIGTGTYSLTVTDALGQTAENSTQLSSLLNNIEAPVVALAGTGIACENGNAWLSATGGEPGTQYNWYDSPAGGNLLFVGSYLEINDITNAQAYFVEARYEGCISNDRTTIFVDVESADASFTADAVLLPVGETVNFTANVGGQSYSWDFGDGNSATGANTSYEYQQAGTYTVSLETETSNGCTDVQSRIIEVVSVMPLQIVVSTASASCSDTQDGSIVVTASGGVPPYNYNWSNGGATNTISGLLAGSYGLTVTDANGNENIESILLDSEVPELVIETVTIGQGLTGCPGTAINLLATANATGVDYRWYDQPTGGDLLYIGAAFPTIVPQQTATYYVEAVADNCSTDDRSAIEVEVNGPTADFTVSPNNLLTGQEATFTPMQQDPTLAYLWNFGDGSIAGTQTGLHTYIEDGIYLASLTVRDSNGCEVTQEQAVNVGFGLTLGVVFDVTDAQCAGESTGAIVAQVVNGIPPYTYNWSNGETEALLQSIAEGTYQLTITDMTGATVVGEATVNSLVADVPLPQVVANNDIVCSDDYLILYAYDNTGTATNFYWYPGPNSTTPIGTGSSYTQLGLAADTESFFVEAANGACRSNGRTSITITEDNPNDGFSASINTVVEDNDVAFSPLIVDSTYTYQWVFGDGTQSAEIFPSHTYEDPGQYTVVLIVTSDNGCTETIQQPAFIEVVPEGSLSVNFNITQIECEGDTNGSIEAQVLNGIPPYIYNWNTGASTGLITNLSSGMYRVTVTDSQGNSAIRNTQISPIFITPNAPSISPDNNTVLCEGQSFVLTASSGQLIDQYYWYSEGELIGTGISIIIEPEANLGIEVQSQRGSCFSEFTMLDYSVQSVDASFTINNGEDALAGESITFNPTQANYATYQWTFGDGQTSDETAPQYTYTDEGTFGITLSVVSQEGCSSSSSQLLEVLPVDALQLIFTVQDLLCDESENGEISLAVNGGLPPYEYLWDDGSTENVRTDLTLGNYEVTVTDSDGVSASGVVEVISLNVILPDPEVEANGGAPVCKLEPAYLSAVVEGYPDAEVLWYDSPTAIMPLENGNVLLIDGLESNTAYYVETLIEGCLSQRSSVPVDVQAPDADFSIDPGNSIDEGDLVQFTPADMNNNNTYYWNFGDNGWSNSMTPYYFYNLPGTFDVTLEVVDADGCSNELIKTDWLTVTPYQGLIDDELEGRAGNMEGSADISGKVFPNPFTNQLSAIFKLSSPGWYQLELLDSYGRPVVQDQILATQHVQSWQLDLLDKHIPPGLYFLRISGANTQAMAKLLKH
jgi:PKD repeat protein